MPYRWTSLGTAGGATNVRLAGPVLFGSQFSPVELVHNSSFPSLSPYSIHCHYSVGTRRTQPLEQALFLLQRRPQPRATRRAAFRFAPLLAAALVPLDRARVVRGRLWGRGVDLAEVSDFSQAVNHVFGIQNHVADAINQGLPLPLFVIDGEHQPGSLFPVHATNGGGTDSCVALKDCTRPERLVVPGNTSRCARLPVWRFPTCPAPNSIEYSTLLHIVRLTQAISNGSAEVRQHI